MSTIEDLIFGRLSAFSGVTAIVGSGSSARIFPGFAEQDTAPPYIVYQRVAGPRVTVLDGASGLAQPVYQIDAYAGTKDAAKALADQIRIALNGFRGTVGSETAKGSTLLDDRDIFEGSTDPRLYRVSADFRISHDEATS